MREARSAPAHTARGYLGLELAGAKNQKTALAALEYYPKEKKIFLLDIYDRIAGKEGQSSDEALLEMLDEMKPGVAKLGVNVPLELPPCLICGCKGRPDKCSNPATRWMRDTTKKAARSLPKSVRIKEFTPYTQRPFELWARYHLMPHIEPFAQFEIDEALGGNKAPLTARMHYLKRRITGMKLLEVWPKLTVAILCPQLGVPKRVISTYRHLEEGIHARTEILEALASHRGVFIYDRDMKKLAHSLTAFDAFICAYTALLSDIGLCDRMPSGFPLDTGWVEYPSLSPRKRAHAHAAEK